MVNKITILQYLREQQGLSRKEFCRISGIPEITIFKIENHKVNSVTQTTLEKIATTLNVTIDLLLNTNNNFESEYVVPLIKYVHPNAGTGIKFSDKIPDINQIDDLEERRKRLYDD